MRWEGREVLNGGKRLGREVGFRAVTINQLESQYTVQRPSKKKETYPLFSRLPHINSQMRQRCPCSPTPADQAHPIFTSSDPPPHTSRTRRLFLKHIRQRSITGITLRPPKLGHPTQRREMFEAWRRLVRPVFCWGWGVAWRWGGRYRELWMVRITSFQNAGG